MDDQKESSMTQAHFMTHMPTSRVYKTLLTLIPFDDLEQNQIQETLKWIESGAPIFRLQKPDIPPQHLVSYFVLFDEKEQSILLVDHKKAQLWLPTGGHVEKDEDPRETVKRECFEELQIQADFWQVAPLFLTSTVTVGLTAGHKDVSFWYVLKGSTREIYIYLIEKNFMTFSGLN